MLIGQLLKPFGYLAIRHPYKWVIDWLYPILLATAALLLCLLADKPEEALLKSGGVISLALSFVQSLPGFYVAALAAIATFGRADIDQILPEPTPKVLIKQRGKDNLVNLTRRRFLAMLFAFLTAESIILVIFSILLLGYGLAIFEFNPNELALGPALTGLMLWAYFLLLLQMLLATFWGLFYLGYKLHE